MPCLSTGDRSLRDKLAEGIRETFDCSGTRLSGDDISACEMNFCPVWTFYHGEMDRLTGRLPEGNDLYTRVPGYEFGREYAGFNIYRQGEWRDMPAS
ncbi:hypothetical protein FACS189415_5320 [Bacteroidia bacterium]|nr:hypothetical protein FACS189415_5320 [Bacteroidia bacterium]